MDPRAHETRRGGGRPGRRKPVRGPAPRPRCPSLRVGEGAVGRLATLDAFADAAGEDRPHRQTGPARAYVLPDRSGGRGGGDARDPAFTDSPPGEGARRGYTKTLNPPYAEWTGMFPALQAGVPSAAARRKGGASANVLVSMWRKTKNVYNVRAGAGGGPSLHGGSTRTGCPTREGDGLRARMAPATCFRAHGSRSAAFSKSGDRSRSTNFGPARRWRSPSRRPPSSRPRSQGKNGQGVSLAIPLTSRTK